LIELPVRDILDLVLVALLIYAVLVSIRDVRGHLALLGIGVLGVVYLVSRQVGLELAATLLQAFFAVSLIVLVVIFQVEIRQGFERIAVLILPADYSDDEAQGWSDVLVSALADMAGAHRGALVVIPGRDPIERFLDGGVSLDGAVSYPILQSIFDPHSPGHDGAVILENGRISRFAVHLPLSTEHRKLRGRGTRHAAALGLAERSDALCVVVSEERGKISLARDGELVELRDVARLTAALREQLPGDAQERARGSHLRRMARRWREVAIALGLSAALWVLVIPGSRTSQRVMDVPVKVENLPPGYVVEEVDPEQVQIVVSGAIRELFLADQAGFEVPIDAFLVKLGRRTFEVGKHDVRLPQGLTVIELEPGQVKLRVQAPADGSK
jgi:uncharacterized protein (TIGR00159 family)